MSIVCDGFSGGRDAGEICDIWYKSVNTFCVLTTKLFCQIWCLMSLPNVNDPVICSPPLNPPVFWDMYSLRYTNCGTVKC